MIDDFTIKLRAASERYIKAFPGEMPDMRAIGDADYYALPQLMDKAVLRGTPIVDTDFIDGLSRPDPEARKVL